MHWGLVCPMCKHEGVDIRIHEVCIARDWWVEDGEFHCEDSRYTGEFVAYVPVCQHPKCGYWEQYDNSKDMLLEWRVPNA